MSKLLWFFGGFVLALAALLLLALGPLERRGALALLLPATQLAPISADPTAPEVAPTPQSTADANKVLSWVRHSATSDACARLDIDSDLQAHYGPCAEGARVAALTPDEANRLRYDLLRYRPLEQQLQADAGAIQETLTTLTLRGNGRLTADLAHQAEIAGWAAQVYARLSEAEHRADLAAQARQRLAASLGVAIEEVRPLAVEAVRWPDACLGLHEAGVFCAQVVTPGYRLTLLAGNTIHEYRAGAYGQLRAVAGFTSPYVLPPLD